MRLLWCVLSTNLNQLSELVFLNAMSESVVFEQPATKLHHTLTCGYGVLLLTDLISTITTTGTPFLAAFCRVGYSIHPKMLGMYPSERKKLMIV